MQRSVYAVLKSRSCKIGRPCGVRKADQTCLIMAKVILKNIGKIYGKNVEAVKNFNLTIEDKEFVVFVGPSGCGKSTTLRMIAGLEEISSGELYIGDKLVNDVQPMDRDIAMVFQNYALYPHMSVFDNMAFALTLRKVPKDEIKRRVLQAAEILDITEYLERKPKELSGGQRQRVAIGRAIVREPQVFLMDEPLSNLDAKLRNSMRAELISLRKRLNTTFVYVTHDQTEAMTLGDRIVVMKDGLIQQIGTPQEVFNFPANRFVAGFIGVPQMNFLENAQLKCSGGVYKVHVLGGEFVLNEAYQHILAEAGTGERSVTVGIRPENMAVVAKEADGAITADVGVTELMGSEIYIHADKNGDKLVIKAGITDKSDVHFSDIHNMKEISFRLDTSRIHLFDRNTGDCLYYAGRERGI